MAASPRAISAYEKLHAGLDHVLALCLSGDDTVPASLRLSAQRATSPFEAWRNVRAVAAERYEHAITKAARRDAKRKLKEQKEAEQAAADPEDDAPLRIVVKPAKIKKEEVKKIKPERTKRNGLEVKMLDLSGANLSPVLTHSKAPPRVNDGGLESLDKLVTVAATTKPLVRVPVVESPRTDLLTRLRRLPLLEDVDPTSSKYRTIAKWLESDDGKDKPMSTSLSSLINKLQKNSVAVSSIKSPSKRQVHLGTETLDDRLKKERSLERKKKQNTKKTNGVKPEPKRRKAMGTEAGQKRKLGGFVVEPDEVEYETGGWEQDSEAEYESDGDASSSDEEEDDVEVKAEMPKQDDVKREPRAVRNGDSGAWPRKSTPPTSTKASPRSAKLPVGLDQPSMTGKEQLATVVTKLREFEKKDEGASTPTYLYYDHTSKAKGSSVASIKQELHAAATATGKAKPYKTDDGTSESNAIVLDDSDEEEDDASDGDFQLRIALPAAPASPAPRRKQQRAPLPMQSKAPVNPPPKATGKAKGKAPLHSTSTKRKNAVSSDEEDSDDAETGEAEFVALGEDEDSSTDADDDMFDLNEDDVYVVESILEVKKGRTLMTNAGRYTKDPDLFLVKWEGYDELTWEPEVNIPKRIINLFNERELAKQACGYQIDKFLQRKVAKNSTTGKDEILYLIQWKGLPQAYWEVKAMLPSKILVWLEKTSRASLAKAPLTGPSPRKKTKK